MSDCLFVYECTLHIAQCAVHSWSLNVGISTIKYVLYAAHIWSCTCTLTKTNSLKHGNEQPSNYLPLYAFNLTRSLKLIHCVFFYRLIFRNIFVSLSFFLQFSKAVLSSLSLPLARTERNFLVELAIKCDLIISFLNA